MGVIYLTTNLINNKKYIGADSNNNPNYYGSGIKIKAALKKYGKHNFKKEILEECDLSMLFEREMFWIKLHDAVNSIDYYNMSEGGSGGYLLNNVESYNKWNEKNFDVSKFSKRRKNKTYEEIYGDNAQNEKNKRKLAQTGKRYNEKSKRKMSKSHKGCVAWNKGLTKENDIRVLNNIKNRKNRRITKKYTIICPNNVIIILYGKNELDDFIKKENLKLKKGKKINITEFLKNKNSKNYNIKIDKI